MTALPPIRHCPFCGEAEACVSEHDETECDMARVYCTTCGAEGPAVWAQHGFYRKPSAAAALAKWNAAVRTAQRTAIEWWNERRRPRS